jgi:hypothetical protein
MVVDWTAEKKNSLAEQVNAAALHNRDQSSSWQRWVMASCLSINGGAAIAMPNLSLASIYNCSRFWGMAWFLSGLVTSIVFGICAAIHMERLSNYFQKSAWSIADNSDIEKLDIPKFKKLRNQERLIFCIQFIGLICFVIAVEGLK